MIQRDYIMRQAEILARALARILLLKEQSQFEKALDEIDLAGKELLGNDFPTLKHLSDKDILKWMHSDNYFDISKYRILSKLLMTEGEVMEAKGDLRTGRIRYLQAFHLLTEAVARDPNQNEDIRQTIAWLADKISNNS